MSLLKFISLKASNKNSDKGPRTAAVLTFAADVINSLVKELTQNSLDARKKKNDELIINVRSVDIDIKNIPNFGQFLAIFQQMKSYWNSKSNQYTVFFETASKAITKNKIKTFVFEDFNTSGLNGNDKGGTFQTCVNSENVSEKNSSDSLGNHGIGKNSVFGLSAIQTVFYSSLNQKKEYKFKGISKLGTYLDVRGVKREEIIQYGSSVSEDEVLLIDDNNIIPEVFRRTEAGLSQFVLGVELEDGWKDNIKKSFITNYWFLFENKKLSVIVNGEKLNHDNYLEVAINLFSDDTAKDNPLPYITAYKERKIVKEKEIYKIGKVKLFLLEAENDEFFPNRIVFLRDGMKIKTDPLGVGGIPTKIVGVIYCENQIGNSILGAMEPHAHDNFHPQLVKSKSSSLNVTPDEASRILKEIDDFKKDSIKEIKDKYTTGAEIVPLVDDLFKSILGGTSSNGNKAITNDESFKRTISNIEIVCKFDSLSKTTLIDKNKNEQINNGDGDGSGIGKGKGGKGVHGNGKSSKGEKGGSAESQIKTKVPSRNTITSRFFKIENESIDGIDFYGLALRSDMGNENFSVVVSQQGDSKSGSMSSKLIKVVNSNDEEIDFDQVLASDGELSGYRLKNLRTIDGLASFYKLKFEAKMDLALKINNNI